MLLHVQVAACLADVVGFQPFTKADQLATLAHAHADLQIYILRLPFSGSDRGLDCAPLRTPSALGLIARRPKRDARSHAC